MQRGDLRPILRRRDFRRLLWTRVVGQLADGVFQGSLAGSVLFNPDQRTSPIAIAMGFAVLLLPYSMLGPYAGVFLDRWSRRNVLVNANLLRAALILPTAALIWSGTDRLVFVLLALGVIATNRFVLTGLSAAMPHAVEDRQLVAANAVATTIGTVVFSLGLGLAVAMQQMLGASNHGYGVIAATAVLGYLAAAAVARASFRANQLGPDDAHWPPAGTAAAIRDVTRGMVAGARHLAGRRGAAYVLLAQTIHRALYGVLAIAALLLFRNYFGKDLSSSAVGLVQVVLAGAAGALLGAVVTPPVIRRIGGRAWVTGLLAAVGVAVAAFGTQFREPVLVGAVFVINIAAQGTKIVVDTALQHECADEFRGRVFSVNDTAFNVAFVLGLFGGALALPENGRSHVVFGGIAAGYLLLAGWYRWVSARPRDPAPAPTAAARPRPPREPADRAPGGGP